MYTEMLAQYQTAITKFTCLAALSNICR